MTRIACLSVLLLGAIVTDSRATQVAFVVSQDYIAAAADGYETDGQIVRPLSNGQMIQKLHSFQHLGILAHIGIVEFPAINPPPTSSNQVRHGAGVREITVPEFISEFLLATEPSRAEWRHRCAHYFPVFSSEASEFALTGEIRDVVHWNMEQLSWSIVNCADISTLQSDENPILELVLLYFPPGGPGVRETTCAINAIPGAASLAYTCDTRDPLADHSDQYLGIFGETRLSYRLAYGVDPELHRKGLRLNSSNGILNRIRLLLAGSQPDPMKDLRLGATARLITPSCANQLAYRLVRWQMEAMEIPWNTAQLQSMQAAKYRPSPRRWLENRRTAGSKEIQEYRWRLGFMHRGHKVEWIDHLHGINRDACHHAPVTRAPVCAGDYTGSCWWKQAPLTAIGRFGTIETSAELDGSFRAIWDDSAFYIQVISTDDDNDPCDRAELILPHKIGFLSRSCRAAQGKPEAKDGIECVAQEGVSERAKAARGERLKTGHIG